MAKLTPMMQQYLNIHEQEPDAILFFRLGDFYEMFFDDAITVSKELHLTLTGKDCGLEERAPMCGVPFHAADQYIAKLVEKGYKVAICEQVQDPKDAKGLVERAIVRVITSGTVTDTNILCEDENNYLMCLYSNLVSIGVTVCDVSTGEASVCSFHGEYATADFLHYLSGIMPAEILVNTLIYQNNDFKKKCEHITNRALTPLHARYFQKDVCEQEIKKQLNIFSLNATGLSDSDEIIKACGALFGYLGETQKKVLEHINHINLHQPNQAMQLDHATKRNLELVRTIRADKKKGSLLWVLDHTVSASGGRVLHKWINEALNDLPCIKQRHDAVHELSYDVVLREDAQQILNEIIDLQRLCSKFGYDTIHGKDLLSLKESLQLIPKIKNLLLTCDSEKLVCIKDGMVDFSEVVELIELSINEGCTVNIRDGHLIRYGFREKIDELKKLRDNAKEILMELEYRERQQTNIKNLKVKYNKVFGYYIEVTKSNLQDVPDHYIRKQTLVNAERFFTEELKEIEHKLLNANEELIDLEVAAFSEIIQNIKKSIPEIQKTAILLGELDVYCSFAEVSAKNNYVRPELNEQGMIDIQAGRHPVIEKMIGLEHFIPNDTYLDLDNNRMSIITGPNMAGKSTYIRQVAIIALMNQIGCFVPCDEANLCVVDRIFTRVGASDDLASGQSTFMVEMNEVSNILRYATNRSLVILDEVGRGTSTFDGLSIAWSVAEFLLDKKILGCKTLFATHYHELTDLDEKEGAVNYTIDIKQTPDGVLFLHKIHKGAADQSYGIEVAKLAGLPSLVIERAEEILRVLEEQEDRTLRTELSEHTFKEDSHRKYEQSKSDLRRLTIADEIISLPLDQLSPIELMNYIAAKQKEMKQ